MPMTHRGSVGTVYVGTRLDVVKIGFTTDLARRLHQLNLDLIDAVPGGYADEQELVRRCARHRSPLPYTRGREWFTPDVFPVLEEAWLDVFGRPLTRSAA